MCTTVRIGQADHKFFCWPMAYSCEPWRSRDTEWL